LVYAPMGIPPAPVAAQPWKVGRPLPNGRGEKWWPYLGGQPAPFNLSGGGEVRPGCHWWIPTT